MIRNITLRVLAYLLLLIVLVVATCYLLSEGEYIPGVATSILAVGCCFRVVWNVRSVNRKLAYFFQALENDDYSIHFPEYGGSHSERFLNGVLNRIKDILQNTFLKIFSSINSFEYRGSGSLKGWMSRILLNEMLKFMKSNSRLNFVEFIPEEMDVPDEYPDTESIPSDVIYDMIRELPDGYRVIFNLYVIEGKSHKEIADLLGIKANSSASQLHRAKAMLARKLQHYRSLNSITV